MVKAKKSVLALLSYLTITKKGLRMQPLFTFR